MSDSTNGEDATSTSGIESEGRRPTVIRSQQTPLSAPVSARKPTVIGDSGGSLSPRATVMIGRSAVVMSSERDAPQQPTSITQTREINISPQAVSAPTTVRGVVRKGVEVAVEDLQKVFPGTSSKVLVRAQTILRGTFVDLFTETTCAEWGADAQAKYARLVDESLALTSQRALQDGVRHVERLHTLLIALSESFEECGSSVLGKLWRRNKEKTPQVVLANSRDEINRLREHLAQALPILRNMQAHLELNNKEAEALVTEVGALSIAAFFVAMHLGEKHVLTECMNDRGRSLMQTMALVREGVLLREASIRQVHMLVSKIHEVSVIVLPAWMERVSVMMTHKKAWTDTDRYTIREGLQDIIQKLD